MNKKLKPCPFCGGEAVMEITYDIHKEPVYFEPHCNTLDCQGLVGGTCGTREMAIEHWNTRTPEIVRCGECTWFNKTSVNTGLCGFKGDTTHKNNFCSFGEMSEE